MYTTETVKKGFEYLGISTVEEREVVIDTLLQNNIQNTILEGERLAREAFENRFLIPVNKDKKFYKELHDATKKRVKELTDHAKRCVDCWIPEDEQANYIVKRDKLHSIINMSAREGVDVTKAKSYPMEQLVEFRGGFAKCLFHEERTASMKLYKKTNTVYCFSCSKKWDTVDVYMKLNNVNFTEAVKKLTCS